MLGAATGSHVQAVRGETHAHGSGAERAHVAPLSRAFQAVHHHDLALRFANGQILRARLPQLLGGAKEPDTVMLKLLHQLIRAIRRTIGRYENLQPVLWVILFEQSPTAGIPRVSRRITSLGPSTMTSPSPCTFSAASGVCSKCCPKSSSPR